MIMEAIIKMDTLSCFFFCPLFFEKSTFRDFRFASLEHKKAYFERKEFPIEVDPVCSFYTGQLLYKPAIAAMHGPHNLVRLGD